MDRLGDAFRQQRTFNAQQGEVDYLKAKAAHVAGSFNDWHPEAFPMASLGNGRWGEPER